MNLDQLIDARIERSDLWAMACAGKISTADLYKGLAALRRQFGDALYDRGQRR